MNQKGLFQISQKSFIIIDRNVYTTLYKDAYIAYPYGRNRSWFFGLGKQVKQ